VDQEEEAAVDQMCEEQKEVLADRVCGAALVDQMQEDQKAVPAEQPVLNDAVLVEQPLSSLVGLDAEQQTDL
jgi:hypothetical protein